MCSECIECWFLWDENKWGCHYGTEKITDGIVTILKDAKTLNHDIYNKQSDNCPKSRGQGLIE